MVMKKAGSEY